MSRHRTTFTIIGLALGAGAWMPGRAAAGGAPQGGWAGDLTNRPGDDDDQSPPDTAGDNGQPNGDDGTTRDGQPAPADDASAAPTGPATDRPVSADPDGPIQPTLDDDLNPARVIVAPRPRPLRRPKYASSDELKNPFTDPELLRPGRRHTEPAPDVRFDDRLKDPFSPSADREILTPSRRLRQAKPDVFDDGLKNPFSPSLDDLTPPTQPRRRPSRPPSLRETTVTAPPPAPASDDELMDPWPDAPRRRFAPIVPDSQAPRLRAIRRAQRHLDVPSPWQRLFRRVTPLFRPGRYVGKPAPRRRKAPAPVLLQKSPFVPGADDQLLEPVLY